MSEFIGFSFCGVHSSKYNVYAISDGRGYNMPLFADFNDSTESVDGYDGTYYFGTHYISKPRTINCFVDGVDENGWRFIQSWLNPKRIGKLTFDETPYKYYTVKVSNTPSFDFVPLSTEDGNGYLYKGIFAITFTAFDPFAYSYVNSVDDYVYFEESHGLWYYDSGILYAGETPPSTITNVADYRHFLLYNGGNEKAKPIITFTGSADVVTVTNNTTSQSFTLEGLNNITMIVDCKKGQVRVEDALASSYHKGDFIELRGANRVTRYEGDDNALHFTKGNNKVTIKKPDLDVVGRFIAVDDDWYKIVSFDFDLDVATLDKNFAGETDEYDVSIIDLNEISISGSGLNLDSVEFDYKFCYL